MSTNPGFAYAICMECKKPTGFAVFPVQPNHQQRCPECEFKVHACDLKEARDAME